MRPVFVSLFPVNAHKQEGSHSPTLTGSAADIRVVPDGGRARHPTGWNQPLRASVFSRAPVTPAK